MYRYSINILIFSFNFSKNNNSDSVGSFGSLKKCIHTEIQCCGTALFFLSAPGLANPGTDFGSASQRRLYPLLNSKPHEGLKNEHLRCKNVLTFSKKFLWKEFNFLKLAFRLPLQTGCAAGTICEQRQGKRKTISKTSIKNIIFII